MDISKTNNTMAEEPTAFNDLVTWIAENWEKIAGFGLASQFIDRFFKWLTKRSEARIKEIYNEQYEDKVKPELNKLAESMDRLRETIGALKDKIK